MYLFSSESEEKGNVFICLTKMTFDIIRCSMAWCQATSADVIENFWLTIFSTNISVSLVVALVFGLALVVCADLRGIITFLTSITWSLRLRRDRHLMADQCGLVTTLLSSPASAGEATLKCPPSRYDKDWRYFSADFHVAYLSAWQLIIFLLLVPRHCIVCVLRFSFSGQGFNV